MSIVKSDNFFRVIEFKGAKNEEWKLKLKKWLSFNLFLIENWIKKWIPSYYTSAWINWKVTCTPLPYLMINSYAF